MSHSRNTKWLRETAHNLLTLFLNIKLKLYLSLWLFFVIDKNSSQLSTYHKCTRNKSRRRPHDTSQVAWNKKEDQNGVILGYFVYYNQKGQLKTYKQQTTVTNAIITGLKPFTEYCVKVTGFTKIGASPEGNCFNVKTSDSGMSLKETIWCFHSVDSV